MTSPLVIVVIPNWNLSKDLVECLDSIRLSTYQNVSTVVVDNGSTDDSVKIVSEQYPWVNLIISSKNLGYAGALNLGIKEGIRLGGQYIFALNNDTVVPPATLSGLVSVMEHNPGYGIVAPKVLYFSKPEITFSLGDKQYPFLPLPVRFGRKKRDISHTNNIMEFDYLFGCAFLIRKELIQEIGLFDTSYFMFYEDADYCRRARDAGYILARITNETILHKASLSVKKVRPEMIYYRARNRSRFYRRYKHGLHPLLTFFALFIGSCGKLISYVLTGDFSSVKPYVKGTFQGFLEEPPAPEGTMLD